MNTLQGKTAFITGAASGIGRASALLFAAEGAAVVALDREPQVEATVAAIRSAGGRAIALIKDSSAEEDVAGAVATAVTEFGSLDVCYANAGISGGLVPFLEETAAALDRGSQRQPDRYLPGGQARGPCDGQAAARLDHLHGIGGRPALGRRAMPYSASKAGVISLVQTAANELAGTGVRINAICPGLIETGMTRPIFEQARARGTEDKIGQLNPLRRPGAPEEIAQMALFLASDAASYVNGQAIAVDGGLSTSHPITMRRD